MTEAVDVIVIGAGVVGLSVARALGLADREVIIVEQHDTFGTETSSRNSEVIHAGIQYRPGGMRAQLAVAGRDALYAFCQSHGVNHSRCEKLLVANGEEELARLKAVMENAKKNGVTDLRIVSAKEALEMEPNIRCDAAIYSPSSGIVDSHGLMLALLGDVENAGGVLAVESPVTGGRVVDDGLELSIGGRDPMVLRANTVVNCAGLYCDQVARSIEGIPAATIPKLYYGKGQYFTYSGAAPFSRLIYPLPSPDSQGVHYTRDIGGQAKLGPDLSFIATNDDYAVDDTRREAFAQSARRFWPDIETAELVPGYAGIRPKIAGPGEEGDFFIQDKSVHGISGYIGLYGIESPGLTTCLAIAEHVAELLE
ncbi:MAG: NAD(P)/FAD-dependent oxidoreductase [Marinicaulis sp.]|nr:NAD(P)/FAD-dependent oxidoreductase [Marinicaulis sp.]